MVSYHAMLWMGLTVAVLLRYTGLTFWLAAFVVVGYSVLLLVIRRRPASGRELELKKALAMYFTAMLLIGVLLFVIVSVAALLR